MTNVDLSYAGLYNFLKEIVEEKGEDYVYTADPDTLAKREPNGGVELNDSCFYGGNVKGKPGCIIGHLIHKLAPKVNLDSLDGTGATGAMCNAGLYVDYRRVEGQFLNAVQRNQDAGRSWGESLRLAKEFADMYVPFTAHYMDSL